MFSTSEGQNGLCVAVRLLYQVTEARGSPKSYLKIQYYRNYPNLEFFYLVIQVKSREKKDIFGLPRASVTWYSKLTSTQRPFWPSEVLNISKLNHAFEITATLTVFSHIWVGRRWCQLMGPFTDHKKKKSWHPKIDNWSIFYYNNIFTCWALYEPCIQIICKTCQQLVFI